MGTHIFTACQTQLEAEDKGRRVKESKRRSLERKRKGNKIAICGDQELLFGKAERESS